MAIPLVPVAAWALKYGTVAATAYAISRKISRSRTDQRVEDALDDLDDGLAAHRAKDRSQVNGSARWRRIIWLRSSGRGFEVDAAALGRFRIRRVNK